MSYREQDGQVILAMSREDYRFLCDSVQTLAEIRIDMWEKLRDFHDRLNQRAPGWAQLLQVIEKTSPEAAEALSHLPADVQAVVADFEKDYSVAVTNFKEAYLSTLTWAAHARDQLTLMKSYLEAEQMREKLGLASKEKS